MSCKPGQSAEIRRYRNGYSEQAGRGCASCGLEDSLPIQLLHYSVAFWFSLEQTRYHLLALDFLFFPDGSTYGQAVPKRPIARPFP